MSSKAHDLRRRMSIDPDAPATATRARPTRLAAAAEPEPAHHDATPPRRPAAVDTPPVDTPPAGPPADPSEQTEQTAEPTEPTEQDEPTEQSAEQTAPTESAPEPASTPPPTPARTPRSRTTRAPRTRGKRDDDLGWETALDDPAIDTDGNGYRSFYVSDAVFARFRAAVYWTARRPDATGVPDNMSVGVEAYMEEVAADLERRYNEGAVFRPTPDQVRAHRRREKGR